MFSNYINFSIHIYYNNGPIYNIYKGSNIQALKFPIETGYFLECAEELSKLIEYFISSKELSYDNFEFYYKKIKDLYGYITSALSVPDNIKNAHVYVGGISSIARNLNPLLIKTSLILSKVEDFYNTKLKLYKNRIGLYIVIHLNDKSINFNQLGHAGDILTAWWKKQLAYRKIYEGKKWLNANLLKNENVKVKAYNEEYINNLREALKEPRYKNSSNLKLAKQIADNSLAQNPIKSLSKINLKKIKAKLGYKEIENPYEPLSLPFSDEEYSILQDIISMPFELIHATNYWYPIENSGKLNSLTEIWRYNSKYESTFSTSGNVKALGNDGFVFFRFTGPTANSVETRYGNTEIKMSPQLLMREGWISLYDQLVPLSSSTMSSIYLDIKTCLLQPPKKKTKNCYLVRKVKAISYKSSLKKPTPADKTILEYTYYDAAKKVIHVEKIDFTEQVFYGGDILWGLGLSFIYTLRCFAPKFTKCILEKYSLLTGKEELRRNYLVDLIFKLFRPEAKFPTAINFVNHKSYLSEIRNPAGDSRFNPGGKVNENIMKSVGEINRLEQLKTQVALVRKQRGRFAADVEGKGKAQHKKLIIKSLSDKKKPDKSKALVSDAINSKEIKKNIERFLLSLKKNIQERIKQELHLDEFLELSAKDKIKKLNTLIQYIKDIDGQRNIDKYFLNLFKEIACKLEINILNAKKDVHLKNLESQINNNKNSKLSNLYQVKSKGQNTHQYTIYIDGKIINLEQIPVTPDGDCFFNSILKNLTIDQKERLFEFYQRWCNYELSDVQNLRNIMNGFLFWNQRDYVDFISLENESRPIFDIYRQLLSRIKICGNWNNQMMDIVVPALPIAINKRVIIYDSHRHTTLSYGPDQDNQPIFVIYDGFSHYDAAIMS